jgi:hypothetical protein
MKNARRPGARRRGMDEGVKRGWERRAEGDSKRRWDVRRERNIIGARWKSVEKGFEVAGVCWRRSWVRDHLRPERAEAVMTRTKLKVSYCQRRGGDPMKTN